ncbi:glycoside hydrolase family 88 protein [Litoribaculum gwangyangense]|uniref:Glycoside hydrolase family 88 protein n=1 Tax=Litoribaculum gwangyangense TaxID=1130722 RepID=A0ABP9CQ03_9FLAO
MCKVKFLTLFSVILLGSCSLNNKVDSKFVEKQMELSERQFLILLKDAERLNKIPRTISINDETHWANKDFDWTEGFFPGSCWYFYEFTDNEFWKEAAEKFQSTFESHKFYTNNHDLGFIFNSSYGNGYRLTGNKSFKKVLVTAGNSLITRFNPNVGCIQSWETDTGWQAERGWKYPVIIDNMMNLELLFELSKITGDDKYKNVATAHANTTLENHFRTDNSSFHLVDYDPENGNIRSKETAQGYSNESSWARGQAWGLYGYTVCYRYTKDVRYLKQAEKIARYIIDNPNIPIDGIPYWDYDAPNKPDEYRDVSAAAVSLSALIELQNYSKQDFTSFIKKVLKSLTSEQYFAKFGDNNGFILKHSVGSIPHNAEIDVPLNYADYYFLEALIKYKRYIEAKS